MFSDVVSNFASEVPFIPSVVETLSAHASREKQTEGFPFECRLSIRHSTLWSKLYFQLLHFGLGKINTDEKNQTSTKSKREQKKSMSLGSCRRSGDAISSTPGRAIQSRLAKKR